MEYPLPWRHVSTCYRVICAYCAYVTIGRTLGDTRCTPRHFVNKVSVRQFSAENKQESAEFYSQHLPIHSRDVIYERSNQNLPSRWVLAWSVQKWILWVIIERWEAFGPSTLRGCRQLGGGGLLFHATDDFGHHRGAYSVLTYDGLNKPTTVKEVLVATIVILSNTCRA